MLKLKYAIFVDPAWYKEYDDYRKKRLAEEEEKTESSDAQKTKLSGKEIAEVVAGGVAGGVIGALFPIPAITVAGAVFVKDKIKEHTGG